MRTVTELHSISAQALDSPVEYGTATSFFRKKCFVPESVILAVERAPEPEILVVDSVGCSIGAEADSALSFYHQLNPEGKMMLMGFDRKRSVLQAARRGLYKVRPSGEAHRDYKGQLRDMGFDVKPSTEMGYPILEVDASPVRAGHDVVFAEHDMKDLAPSRAANLRLANNLLYYFPRPDAVKVLRRLCETLPDEGVIGLGALTMSDPWRQEDLGSLMRDEFDMEPLLTAEGGSLQEPVPVLFGRTG
jgi:chemotaxis methyl-accepting protein methylase